MSHKATNWAVEQRGIRPAAKVVLWHLANRHNPDYGGSFPSQELLAYDCEMSRSALNENLKTLEEVGLIRRVRARDPETKQQLATRYLLAFEFDRDGTATSSEPCPKSGHGNSAEAASGKDEKPSPDSGESRVRNPDSKPVREPVSEPVIERERASAAEADGEGETQDVEPHAMADDRKALKALTVAHTTWPTYAADSVPQTQRAFLDNAAADRAEGLEKAAAYIAHVTKTLGRAKVCAFATYWREQRWKQLPPAALTAGEAVLKREDDFAPAFGPVWSAWRMAALLAGPDNPDAPEFQSHKRYQRVSQFQSAAARGVGRRVSERWKRLEGAMEPVPVDSALMAEWHSEHDLRGWPWLPDYGQMPVVWFPKGGPDGLEEFSEAVRSTADASDEGKAA